MAGLSNHEAETVPYDDVTHSCGSTPYIQVRPYNVHSDSGAGQFFVMAVYKALHVFVLVCLAVVCAYSGNLFNVCPFQRDYFFFIKYFLQFSLSLHACAYTYDKQMKIDLTTLVV